MKEVVIEIKVEGADEAEKSLGEVEKSINDVNKAAKNTKLNIGDSINKDVKDATTNLDGFEKKLVRTNNVMQSSKGTAQLLGGSVRVAGTAFAALGVQSTEVTNALGRVQGVSQFAGGVRDLTKGLGNLGGGFKILGAAAKAVPFVGIAISVFEVVKATGALDGVLEKAGLQFEKVSVAAEAFNKASEKAIGVYAKEKVGLDELFNSLRDVNTTTEDKKRIIDEVNNKYGEYLPNLLTEKSTNEEIAVAYDLVNSSLIRKALTQAKTNALEIATTDLLNKRLVVQKELARVEKELLFISSTQQLNRLQKEREDIIKQINKIEDDFKTEVAKIDKVAKDLEANLFKPVSNLTDAELEKKRLEALRRKREEDAKKQRQTNTSNAKDRLALLAKEQQDALKLIQERYAKEIDDINEFKLQQENLLKEDLANRKITQQEFDDAILALNVGVNDKLIKQNENFIVTDAEKKKIGADGELILQEQLNDDKLKLNGAYFDALNAINVKQDERTKAQREKEAEDEKKRLEELEAEEKRILQERLQNFNNEYILKKTAILREGNLKEEQLDLALAEAQLENLKNLITAYELGSEDYFKLLEDIAAKEVEINKKKEKIILDDIKQRQEDIKNGFEASVDIANQTVNAFNSLADASFAIRTKNLEKGSAAELKAAKKDFEVRKKLSIAGAVVSGIEGIVNTLTAKSTIPQPFDDIYRGIKVALIVASTAANIAKINAQKFDGGGSASAGGGGSSIPSVNTSGSIAPTTFAPTTFGTGVGQSQTFGGQPGSGGGNVLRAYVSETDLVETQRRLRNIRQAGEL